jgi:hypothetical protein
MQINKWCAAALLCGALALGGCDKGAGGGAAKSAGGDASAKGDSVSGSDVDPAALDVSTDTQKIDSGGAGVEVEAN